MTSLFMYERTVCQCVKDNGISYIQKLRMQGWQSRKIFSNYPSTQKKYGKKKSKLNLVQRKGKLKERKENTEI